MSLLSRLWISIGALLLTVFAVTLTVFGVSGSNTLQQQLAVETENTARSLAQVLSLEAEASSLERLDPVIVQLRLSPFTDLSEFQSVELRDPTGEVIFRSQNTPVTPTAPIWFVELFEVETFPVSAPVMLGWDNWELSLTPHGGGVYDELWTATKRSAFAMMAAFFVAGIIGQIILSRLLQPLSNVVTQASGIGQRRFTQIEVPKTTEFAAVARSMNELSRRVQTMLADEAQSLQSKKASAELDETTGLLNRNVFVDQLKTKLSREDAESSGSIALIRLVGLAEMNREYGRKTVDDLLSEVGVQLNSLSNESNYGSYFSIGRMNGADLCATASTESNAKNLADTLQRITTSVLKKYDIDPKFGVAAACMEFEYGDGIGNLFSAMDNALAQSELQAGAPVVPAQHTNTSGDPRSKQQFWQTHLSNALSENRLVLKWYPVKDKDNHVIHMEGMARVVIEGEEFNAGQFMPWVFRLGLGKTFDQAVINCALSELKEKDDRLHVNLSADSMQGGDFTEWLLGKLQSFEGDVTRLGVELSETAVLSAKEQFGTLVAGVTRLECQAGIEHMGYRPEIIAELAQLGPSYLKVDSLYTKDLDVNEGNRSVVTSLAGVAKSLGIECIAEGVSTNEDVAALFKLGIKGASGKAVT